MWQTSLCLGRAAWPFVPWFTDTGLILCEYLKKIHPEHGDWHFIDGKVFCLFYPPPVCELVQTLPSISHCGLKERTETASFQNDWSAVFYVFAGCKWCLLPAWDLVYYCKWGDSHQLKYPPGSPGAELSSFPPLFSHTKAYMNALLTLTYNINNAISIHNA